MDCLWSQYLLERGKQEASNIPEHVVDCSYRFLKNSGLKVKVRVAEIPVCKEVIAN